MSVGGVTLAPSIGALMVLDGEGRRVFSKYYWDRYPSLPAQLDFERTLLAKCAKTPARVDAEVLVLERQIVIYKFIGDVYFIVIGSERENELILSSVLSALEETMSKVLSGPIDRKNLLEHLDLLILAADEIIDDGIIAENDSEILASRVSLKGAEREMPLGEQTLKGALKSATDQFFKSFRS